MHLQSLKVRYQAVKEKMNKKNIRKYIIVQEDLNWYRINIPFFLKKKTL